MSKCLTTPILFSEFSGCLVEKPECSYAHKFGFSFLCRNPDHAKFHSHVADSLTRDEATDLYSRLRTKRRNEFIASQDEAGNKYFYYQTDFFGQPLTNTGK